MWRLFYVDECRTTQEDGVKKCKMAASCGASSEIIKRGKSILRVLDFKI